MRITALALIAALVICFAGCGGAAEAPGPVGTAEATEIRESPEAETTFRRATLYYVSDEGYVVPVTKLIPWEAGIARACLGYMVGTRENTAAAKRMGLVPAIPDGVDMTISIIDGNAKVDLTGYAGLPTAEAELDMIEAIVNTLTEFATVSTVTITRGGEGGTLENGTQLPVRQGAYHLNPEDPELAASAGSAAATLYFPNLSGALTVPVTRYLGKSTSVYAVVSALIDGARGKGLMSCFPENTLLLGAAIENGMATVNLSEDFAAAAQTEGLFSLAYRSLWLTLRELYDFERLEIQVNGRPFAPEEVTPPYSVNGY